MKKGRLMLPNDHQRIIYGGGSMIPGGWNFPQQWVGPGGLPPGYNGGGWVQPYPQPYPQQQPWLGPGGLPPTQHNLYQQCLNNCYQNYGQNDQMYQACVYQCMRQYGYRDGGCCP
ncbi:hypothetical protein [Pseudalkalibacillus hwajinpoensis]|uniref:hypothetical protein n=1 Tax=Guptibacillus hwajinpoensis TaxID=208199 RepID=UPI001CFC93A9|nr:hypothetical protein [Pseudalkalibacillus hwajinpoensis]